jgi:hypothetical protein
MLLLRGIGEGATDIPQAYRHVTVSESRQQCSFSQLLIDC